MATKKPASNEKAYSISAKLALDVSKIIYAASLEQAIEKALALKQEDFVDLNACELELLDYETPDIYGVYRA